MVLYESVSQIEVFPVDPFAFFEAISVISEIRAIGTKVTLK